MKFSAMKEGNGERSTIGKNTFLRLKDGESVKVVFRGDPLHYRQHWVAGKGIYCPGHATCQTCQAGGEKPGFRFRVNAITIENGAYVAKIFEQCWASYQQMKSLSEDYDLERYTVKIMRKGSGPKDTTYSIVPTPDGKVSPELEKKLAAIPLHDLTPRGAVKAPETSVPPPKDEDMPFASVPENFSGNFEEGNEDFR